MRRTIRSLPRFSRLLQGKSTREKSVRMPPVKIRKVFRGKRLRKLAILGTRGIPARYGGFETFAEQLATRLADHGIDVTVFCPSTVARSDEAFRLVTLKFVRFPSLGKYSEMIWDARCFFVARRNFDVVYMLGLGGAFAAWVPRVFGAQVWVNTDGVEWKRTKFTWPQRAYLALAEALSIAFANRIIADAEAIATYLRRRYPSLKKVCKIAYGADIPTNNVAGKAIESFGLKADEYYIMVCRLEPENHVLEIIRGFELAGSSRPLVIFGNIEKPNLYVSQLLEHKSDSVRFLGTLYDNDKLTALRFSARAYFHGHSVGGTNPSLLEAMACSNLVIAHDNPFNREVIGDSGLFFRSSEELARVVMALESGDIRGELLRQSAAQRIREHYQWDQIAESYLKLLKAE